VLHEIAGSEALADDAAATIFLAGILARPDGPELGAYGGGTCLPRRWIWRGSRQDG
jgi:hypothetical protein